MTPAARLAAAAEVLDAVGASAAPAESVLKTWGQAHRFAGSKDRRAIADRVYRCLRHRARLAWAGESGDGRTLVLFSLALLDDLDVPAIETLYTGEGYGPAPLIAEERARLSAPPGEPPAWVAAGLPHFTAEDFQRRFGDAWAEEADALMLPRAPVDLRVNSARSSREAAMAALAAEGIESAPSPLSAWGLRLSAQPAPDVQTLEAFRDGRIEIQDEGSQLAAWLGGAKPGETVIDFCAGGGGKTLALAQGMAGSGRLVACDVELRRVEAIRPRLDRAGLEADLRVLGSHGEGVEDLAEAAHLVFVDAPCSGSGTWRRRPEAAWRLTSDEVERLHALQVSILARAARLVRPGGRLAYVTCSVLGRENEDSAEAFAAAHPQLSPTPIVDALNTPDLTLAARARLAELAGASHRLQLTPHRTQTDGFFIALFQRTA